VSHRLSRGVVQLVEVPDVIYNDSFRHDLVEISLYPLAAACVGKYILTTIVIGQYLLFSLLYVLLFGRPLLEKRSKVGLIRFAVVKDDVMTPFERGSQLLIPPAVVPGDFVPEVLFAKDFVEHKFDVVADMPI